MSLRILNDMRSSKCSKRVSKKSNCITAKEKHLTLGVSDTNAFNTIQDALQFSPIYDDSEVQDGNE